jgi:peroxiredoxin
LKEHATPADERLGTLPAGIGLPVGSTAPDAQLKDAQGREVNLREVAAHGGDTLIVFYRGGWCPYCNFQIHELTAAYPEFRDRGVLPVAISVDRAEEAARTQATYEIPFPVLSDPELSAHRAYLVLHQVDEAEFARLQGFGHDLERASGQTHHLIAVPAMFLIDSTGQVRWAHADRDYKVRPGVSQLLAAIDRLRVPQG